MNRPINKIGKAAIRKKKTDALKPPATALIPPVFATVIDPPITTKRIMIVNTTVPISETTRDSVVCFDIYPDLAFRNCRVIVP